MFAGRFEDDGYAIAYSIVVTLLAILIGILAVRAKKERAQDSGKPCSLLPFRVHPFVIEGIAAGVIGIAAWIWLSDLQLERRIANYLPSFMQPGERESYNPFETLSPGVAWAFIAFRIFGIGIVVPVAEELFWRGFLLRWLIDPDWEKLPLGQFSLQSFSVVVLLFTLAHPEWFAAALWCALINGLLYWKRDLWQCIVAHSVSNLLLVAYVLAYDQWYLW